MIKTILAVAALAASCVAAWAQGGFIGVQYVPMGYCQLTPSVATKLSSCSGGIPAGSNVVVIKTESQAIRFRDDGTAPSAAVGQPIATTDQPYWYQGNLSALQIIQQSASATVDVSFYKVP